MANKLTPLEQHKHNWYMKYVTRAKRLGFKLERLRPAIKAGGTIHHFSLEGHDTYETFNSYWAITNFLDLYVNK